MSELPPSLRERSLIIALHALRWLTWVAPFSLFGLGVWVTTLIMRDVSPWIVGGVLLGGYGLALFVTLSAGSWLPKARDAAFRLKGERIVVAARRDDRAPFVAIHSFADDASWRVAYGTPGFTAKAAYWRAREAVRTHFLPRGTVVKFARFSEDEVKMLEASGAEVFLTGEVLESSGRTRPMEWRVALRYDGQKAEWSMTPPVGSALP